MGSGDDSKTAKCKDDRKINARKHPETEGHYREDFTCLDAAVEEECVMVQAEEDSRDENRCCYRRRLVDVEQVLKNNH